MESRENTKEKQYTIRTRSSDKSTCMKKSNQKVIEINSDIKRPRNPYIQFIMDTKQKEKASKGEIKGRELIKRMGQIWKEMTIEKKKPYEDLYKLEKTSYHQKLESLGDEFTKKTSKEVKEVKKISPNPPQKNRKKSINKRYNKSS